MISDFTSQTPFRDLSIYTITFDSLYFCLFPDQVFTACLGCVIGQSYGTKPFCFLNIIALWGKAERLFNMAGRLGVFFRQFLL